MSTLKSEDLGLDPSDPLNLLLHNHSQHNLDDDSSPSFTTIDLGIGMDIDTTDFGLFNPFRFTFETPSPLLSSESESGGSTGSFSPPPSMRAASNAGLVLAVQIGSDPQYHPPAFTAPPPPSYPTPNTATSVFTTTATQSRPKISPTTIERRYRTNLNTRIQSLPQVVPALRVHGVVDRVAAIKAGEPYPVCTFPSGESDDEGGGGRKRKEAKAGEKKKCGRPRKVVPLPASAAASALANSSHVASPALSTSVPMHSSTAASSSKTSPAARANTSSAHSRSSRSSPTPTSLPLPPNYRMRTKGTSSHRWASRARCMYGYGLEGGMGLLQAFHLPASAAVLVSAMWPVGRGVWARYLASASASSAPPPTLLEKTKVGEEEEGSETETDGERSAGSVGSLSKEDVDAFEQGSQIQAQAHREAEACILYDSTPLRTRLRTAFRLYTSAPPSTSSTSASTTPRSSVRARSSTETADARWRLLALLVRPVPLLGARVAPRLWVGIDDAAWADEARACNACNAHPHPRTKPNTNTRAGTKANAKGGRATHVGGRRGGGAAAHGRGTGVRAGGVGGFFYLHRFYFHFPRLHYIVFIDFHRRLHERGHRRLRRRNHRHPREVARARERERREERAALEVARGLGGRIARLGVRVGCVVEGSSLSNEGLDDEDGEEEQDGAEADVEKLLRAIVLYRRVFGSPSSPSAFPAWTLKHFTGGANADREEANFERSIGLAFG
ncbi:hypothetical protein B0H16DRAFT_1829349 [Mycena metata]|uniref:Uncharacterized protein n=1 Tax=Mycena metata TaxID=1033252 RepID=A0AAD7GRP4_9AGAR|nr:hypothetical protein B0H16DRAFT_1829349 [Mycena metata]